MSDYESILERAIEITEDASEIALSYFRQAILIEMKQNQTPVTIADRKTEEFMREALLRDFPDFGVLGEEFGEEGSEKEFVWTIDPIDGTRSFIRGIPLFGTLLGLLRDGKPVLGVMVLPALDEVYYAAEDLGAHCNDHSIHVSSISGIESSLISCGDTSVFRAANEMRLYEKLVSKAGDTRGYTDCFGHSLVMRGAIDAMIDPGVSIWDVAPLACIISEAGGEYFSFQGETTITDKTFVACTPGLREDILSLINQTR